MASTSGWHPETLFVTAALAHDIGSPVIPDSVGHLAFERSSDIVVWALRHKLLDQTARYATFLELSDTGLQSAARQVGLRAMQSAVLNAAAYRVLAEAGCRPLAIKGPVLALVTGDGVVGRGVGDVDLAVAPERLAAAVDALVQAGAKVTSSPRVGWRMHAVNLSWRGVAIDLHHRMYKSPMIGRDMDVLWERGQDIDLAGTRVRTLSLTDTAVHVAVSAGMDTWSQLVRIRDFDRLLTMMPARDELDRTAREWNAESLLRLADAMLRRLRPEVPRQSPVAEALAARAWLWVAQGRQLRLEQDQVSRFERELFRVGAVSQVDFAWWTAARNATRPWGDAVIVRSS